MGNQKQKRHKGLVAILPRCELVLLRMCSDAPFSVLSVLPCATWDTEQEEETEEPEYSLDN